MKNRNQSLIILMRFLMVGLNACSLHPENTPAHELTGIEGLL